MNRSVRPLAAVLLGLLVLAWGPCPGTIVKMLRGSPEPQESSTARCGCGCCEKEAPATPDLPVDEDCPYCSHHGARPYGVPADLQIELVDELVAVTAGDALVVLTPRDVVSDTPPGISHGPPPGARLATVILLL